MHLHAPSLHRTPKSAPVALPSYSDNRPNSMFRRRIFPGRAFPRWTPSTLGESHLWSSNGIGDVFIRARNSLKGSLLSRLTSKRMCFLTPDFPNLSDRCPPPAASAVEDTFDGGSNQEKDLSSASWDDDLWRDGDRVTEGEKSYGLESSMLKRLTACLPRGAAGISQATGASDDVVERLSTLTHMLRLTRFFPLNIQLETHY